MSTDQNYIVAGHGDDALDAWGRQKVVQESSHFHGLFTYSIPPQQWVLYRNGVEVLNLAASVHAFSENGEGVIACEASIGDTTYVHGKRHSRYRPNRGHHYAVSTTGLPNPGAAAVRDFGLFSPDNGAFFRLKSGTLFACIQSGGVITHEEEITLPSDFGDIDQEKGLTWDIKFQWRGVGNYSFMMGDPSRDSGEIRIVHRIKIFNKQSVLSMENPALPAGFRVVSLGDAAQIRAGCVDISSEGGGREQLFINSAFNEDPVSVTNVDTGVLALRQPDMADGSWNTRDIELLRIQLTCDKKATARMWVTRDPSAFIGVTDWTNIGGGSFVEQSVFTTGTFDTSKARTVVPFKLNANITTTLENPHKDKVDFNLIHGDHLIFTFKANIGNSEAVAVIGEEI